MEEEEDDKHLFSKELIQKVHKALSLTSYHGGLKAYNHIQGQRKAGNLATSWEGMSSVLTQEAFS